MKALKLRYLFQRLHVAAVVTWFHIADLLSAVILPSSARFLSPALLHNSLYLVPIMTL